MNFDGFLNKPFLISSGVWGNASVRGTVVDETNIPSALLAFNSFLATPFKRSAYFRAKMKAVVTISTTPQQSGTLIFGAYPQGYLGASGQLNEIKSMNYFLTAPHAFVYANQTNPVCIEVPMYINTPLAKCKVGADVARFNPSNDVASLGLIVMNPILGTSSAIPYNIHLVFEELDFYVPASYEYASPTPPGRFSAQSFEGIKTKTSQAIDSVFGTVGTWAKTITQDILDIGRSSIRAFTGLHNPNRPILNQKVYVQSRNQIDYVEGQTALDKLDPFPEYTRVCDDYYFKTDVDEGDVNFICSKYQHIGTAKVTTTTAANTLLFSRPITPFQEVSESADGKTIYVTSVLEKMACMAAAWSGDMEVMIQSSMTNFQHAKLMVVLDYSKSERFLTTFPNPDEASGLMVKILEFAGGGTCQTFKLPYLSEFAHIPINYSWRSAACLHGMYHVYLLQPVINGNSQPGEIYFNFYLRAAPNFQLYGYSSYNLRQAHYVIPPLRNEESEREEITFQPQSQLSQAVPTLPQPYSSPDKTSRPFTAQIRPIVNIRDIGRRMCCAYTEVLYPEVGAESTVSLLSIADLIGVSNETFVADRPSPPLATLLSMYMGYRGGLKFKIVAEGCNDMMVQYLPPSCYVDGGLVSMGTPVVPTAIGAIDYGSDENTSFPFLETCNYWRQVPLVKGTGTSDDPVENDCMSIAEFEIPYMSSFDFVGTATGRSLASVDLASESLGYIAITLTTALGIQGHSSGDPPVQVPFTPGAISLAYYVGMADEARMGLSVINTNLAYNTYVYENPLPTPVEYTALKGFLGNSSLPMKASKLDATTAKAYYTKTA